MKVRSMLKDYQSTTTGGAEFGDSANDEQHVVDVSKQITDISLTGTEIRDTWVSNFRSLTTRNILRRPLASSQCHGKKSAKC